MFSAVKQEFINRLNQAHAQLTKELAEASPTPEELQEVRIGFFNKFALDIVLSRAPAHYSDIADPAYDSYFDENSIRSALRVVDEKIWLQVKDINTQLERYQNKKLTNKQTLFCTELKNIRTKFESLRGQLGNSVAAVYQLDRERNARRNSCKEPTNKDLKLVEAELATFLKSRNLSVDRELIRKLSPVLPMFFVPGRGFDMDGTILIECWIDICLRQRKLATDHSFDALMPDLSRILDEVVKDSEKDSLLLELKDIDSFIKQLASHKDSLETLRSSIRDLSTQLESTKKLSYKPMLEDLYLKLKSVESLIRDFNCVESNLRVLKQGLLEIDDEQQRQSSEKQVSPEKAASPGKSRFGVFWNEQATGNPSNQPGAQLTLGRK